MSIYFVTYKKRSGNVHSNLRSAYYPNAMLANLQHLTYPDIHLLLINI